MPGDLGLVNIQTQARWGNFAAANGIPIAYQVVMPGNVVLAECLLTIKVWRTNVNMQAAANATKRLQGLVR